MKAKKEIVQKAVENGSMDKVNKLLSAVHLLNSQANDMVEEASDILRDNKLLMGELKKYHSGFVRCADRYFNCFAEIIADSGQGQAYFKDLEEFNIHFRDWAKI